MQFIEGCRWYSQHELHPGLLAHLHVAAGGLLSMNFHRDLLAMGQEVHHWERLRMPIPYIAMEINAQRDKYRVLRDNILMVGGQLVLLGSVLRSNT